MIRIRDGIFEIILADSNCVNGRTFIPTDMAAETMGCDEKDILKAMGTLRDRLPDYRFPVLICNKKPHVSLDFVKIGMMIILEMRNKMDEKMAIDTSVVPVKNPSQGKKVSSGKGIPMKSKVKIGVIKRGRGK